MRITTLIICAMCMILLGGCKDKNLCKSEPFEINPFLERYSHFTCGGNLYEYQYIKRSKEEIDSLSDCTFSPPVPFPVDETDFVYIMFGKMSYHYRDTFQTTLLKDTCNKKLVYQVDMIQQFTTENTFPGVVSTFCAVENIPADYEVEVKYKYVPIQ